MLALCPTHRLEEEAEEGTQSCESVTCDVMSHSHLYEKVSICQFFVVLFEDSLLNLVFSL